MAARTIEIPSFDFSAFYYPQLLEALIRYKRANVPELTDESDFEPFIQLLRAFALVGHQNNVLIDLVANESTLPTAQLVETVRNMLRLIDYELDAATPAVVDVVYELSKVFTTTYGLVPAESRCATQADDDNPAIDFEALEGTTISRTDQLTAAFRESPSQVFTDHTAAANGGSFAPILNLAGSKLYFGHDSVMWDVMEIIVSIAQTNIQGVWEFYDGDFEDIQPTAVVDLGGGQLQFDLTSLLGALNRAGATVRVKSNENGQYEDVVSTWNGSINIAVTSYLSQAVPSLVASDYRIGSEWTEMAAAGIDFTDGSLSLTQTGELEYVLPQSELLNWRKGTVNNVEAFWLRWRTITSVGGTNPTIGPVRIDTGKQYATAKVTQGRTVADDPLGSSNGAPNQRFVTTRQYFIASSEIVTVDDEPWVRVRDFLASGSQDKHYRIELGENDKATVVFGDGVKGRIPDIGQGNISIEYRVDANLDGNVGARKITVDKTGLTFVSKLYNPRQAAGWATAEGATPESLEAAKISGPASLRTKDVAIGPDDLITLANEFVASDGSSPFVRATYFEEGYGPKTVKLVVVGAGGGPVPQAILDELDLYFNGDKFASPPVPKHFVANQEVTTVNYVPRPIDVNAVVKAPASVTAADVINRLALILRPEALKEDGVTYEWNFGGAVPMSRLVHEIFKTDEKIEDVDITGPDVILAGDELPVVGTLYIAMVLA
jgi:hypothetical protein